MMEKDEKNGCGSEPVQGRVETFIFWRRLVRRVIDFAHGLRWGDLRREPTAISDVRLQEDSLARVYRPC